MKNLRSLYFFLLYFVLFTSSLLADVTITQASNGTNIPAHYALNGSNPTYTTLGDIVIEENYYCDISANQSNVTLILKVPDNWKFKAGVGSASHNMTYTDITSMSIIVTETTITVTFSTDYYCNKKDWIKISGIQVIAINGYKCYCKDITSAGTSKIAGISDCWLLKTTGTSGTSGTTCCTIFGKLSLDCGPVPVELSSFTASFNRSVVSLNWETKTEVNNYGFEIERASSSTSPIQGWERIGFVIGAGNNNSPKNYSFEDNQAPGYGKYSYRLKQIDNDGKIDYSPIVEVDLGAVNEYVLNQNYPNPFNPSTMIKYAIPQAGNVKLSVYNILGSEVATLVNEFQEAGIYTKEFSINNGLNLSNGVYVYKLEAGNFADTKKFILLK
jgi:hypothetical protein